MTTTFAINATLTLVEVAKRLDPNGDIATIAEILARDNEILEDAVWVEANDLWGNKTTQRATLPAGYHRRFNQGVATEQSLTTEVNDVVALLEARAQCDKDLCDSMPNPAQYRMGEAAAFIEGMSQTMATAIIYGNALVPTVALGQPPHGFSPRVPVSTAPNAITQGGTGADLTSVWVVQWGIDKVHMIYPRGSKAGIQRFDLGEQTVASVSTSTGDPNAYLQVYADRFVAKYGLVVKNPRCIQRVCNIETAGTSNILDEDNLIKVLNRMPMRGRNAVIYCNTTILSQIDILAKDKVNVNWSTRDWGGVPTQFFRGCPIRKVDAILDTETAI
jgi:hypothetical protein